MDYIKLAQRTIAMLSSMIESGECHTTRSKEMKDNALNGLEQLRIHDAIGQREQLVCPKCGCNKITGDGSKSWCLNERCDFVEAD